MRRWVEKSLRKFWERRGLIGMLGLDRGGFSVAFVGFVSMLDDGLHREEHSTMNSCDHFSDG